jgi:CheY-like chemotaxis protein
MNNLGHILMADDSKEHLELAQRALAQSKLANRIVVVRDGAETLEYLYRWGSFSMRDHPDPIVALLDISMPMVRTIGKFWAILIEGPQATAKTAALGEKKRPGG